MVLDRVLIKDTDHLAHFTADLGASLSSHSFADVVLRCGGGGAATGGTGAKKAASFPTLRVHRAVLASMSDFLAELIRPHPLEEDVHITLDETAFEVARRIVEFSYAGEVRIAKQLVTSVCDAAHRLQIKFLKDSFVKVTDKDYAAMKAGKKTLDTIQKEIKGVVVSPATSPFKKPPSPTKGKATKAAVQGKGGKASTSKVDSDTDSADSDDEGRTIKVPAGGVVTSKRSAPKKAKSKAKSETVMFTLTKQVEDNSTKLVSDSGTFLVHFNQKSAENQENRAPPKPVLTKKQMVIPTSVAISSSVSIPSSVASIQQPLPPSALPRVKKVMIPPMIRKPTVTLPKNSASPPTFTISKGPISTSSSPQRVISLNTFQVQTIRQADGTQIQVLKPPSGTIMKQMKSTNAGPTVVRPIVPSREPPKDALAIAMEAIAGRSAPLRIDLPKNPVPLTRVVLPTSPVAVSKIVLPVKPLPVSAISGLKKVVPSPIKGIISGVKGPQSIAILQAHPPGYAPVNRVSPAKAIDVPASVLTTSRHSVSQPKLGIPSTVPDDFLMTEDSSEGSVNAASNAPAAKGRKVAVPKTKAVSKAKGAKAIPAKKADSSKPNDAKEPAKVTKVSTPAKSVLTKELLDASTRSSGRVRKVNPKYMEKEAGGDDGDDKSKSSTSSNVSKVSDVAEVSKEKSDPKGNRKRKISSSASEGEEKEEAKKQKTTPAAKKAADNSRKTRAPAQASSNKKSSSKPENLKASKGKESGKAAKKTAPKKAAQDRTRTIIAKSDDKTSAGRSLRKRRALE